MDNQGTIDGWITTQQAAKILKLTGRRILQLIELGELEGKKLHNRQWMIKLESVERYKDCHRKESL